MRCDKYRNARLKDKFEEHKSVYVVHIVFLGYHSDKLILDHKRIFVFLIALSVVLCSIGLKMTESHTAEIIIKYICDSAEEGLTENGQKINPYEINSSLVVKNAVSALGLKNTNIEGICRNITVTPIIPISEQEKYASWIEKFSD